MRYDQFKALGHPTRLTLLEIIAQGKGHLNVFQLEAQLNQRLKQEKKRPKKQPTVSHHLRILTDAGLVEGEKYKLERYYRLKSGCLQPLLETITALQQEEIVWT